jgi:uncharacterized protein
MLMEPRPLAVVTGASTGIGFELARCCAEGGFDLLIAARHPDIHASAEILRGIGVEVVALEVDLATREGVDTLYDQLQGRPVDALLANAGRGLGGAFLDQPFEEVQGVIDTNVTGTLYLIQAVGRDMRQRGRGRILITGSIAGYLPGTYQAVYNGTKALLDSFSFALRAELEGTGVSVTCLLPGASETPFFERAGMLDTKVGSDTKDPADEVARMGYEAMMRGDSKVIPGFVNKLWAVMSKVMPPSIGAAVSRSVAEPGSADRDLPRPRPRHTESAVRPSER